MTRQSTGNTQPSGASAEPWLETDIRERIAEVKVLLALGMPYRRVNEKLATELAALKSLLALGRRART
jgi:hypothetical protein